MAQADGSIIIDTKIDADGLDDAGKEFRKVFGKVSDSAEDMGDSIDDAVTVAARSLKKAGNAADDYAEQADKAADKSKSAFREMFSAATLSNIAVDGLKSVGTALKNFVVGSVEAAAEVKAMNAQFSETFKGMESAATKSLKKIEKQTKMTASRMKSSYTKIFAYTKTVGAKSSEALDLTNRAMVAAADSAAYYDKSLEETVETLQSFLKGNYENDAALGIAATETTRNTMANRLYAKSFNELSEAQKVDTLLAMVEAGNKASGALGQASRESDSWTNSTAELNEAMKQLQAVIGGPIISGLTPIIKGITNAISGLFEVTEADKLRQNLGKIVQSFEEAEKQFEQTTRKTEANATVAKALVKRLKELEDAGLDTAESQRKYAVTVKALNEIMPDLNLAIDEQTGLVNMETTAIEKQIEAIRERAVVSAYEELYTEALKAQADSMMVLSEAEAQLMDLEAERLILEEQISEATNGQVTGSEALTNKIQDMNEAFLGTTAVVIEADAAFSNADASSSNLNASYADLADKLYQNQIEQTKLNNTIGDAQIIYDQYGEDIRHIEDAIENFIPTTQQAAEAVEGIGIAVSDMISELDELDVKFQEAEKEARASVDSQVGYFSELKDTSNENAKEIIQNWDDQKTAFDRYTKNLEKAVEMGLDETLVQQLADGSSESMAILNEFVNSTDSSIDEINAAWERMNESRQTVAEAIAAIQTEVEEKLGEIVEDAKEAGIDTVQALADHIKDNTSYVSRAMQELAKAAISAYNRTISNGSYKKPGGGSTNAQNAGMSTYETRTSSTSPAATSSMDTVQTASAEPMARLMTTMSAVSPTMPVLAASTIIPPQAMTSGASAFAKAGNSGPNAVNLNQREVVDAISSVGMAILEKQAQMLEAVLGIEIDGETLTNAMENYKRKRAVSLGG